MRTACLSVIIAFGNRFVYKFVLLSLSLTLFIGIKFSYAQDNAEQLYRKGYHHLSVDKVKAIFYLSQCLLKDSSHIDAYFHRGVTYFKLGKYDSALFDFNRAYKLNSDLVIIWMYKGFTYRNQGQLDKALDCFSNYISSNPKDTSAYSYILRGKMKYELGDFQGAVEDYDMAMKLKPFEEKYHYYRYIALFEAGKYEEALEAVENLIRISPSFYGYYIYKGNVHFELKQFDKAVGMYSVSIIKNYQNAESYYHRAQALVQKGDLEKAVEDYNTAIMLKPSEGTYYSKRGNIKLKLDDRPGACSDWAEAGALGYYEDYDKMKSFCDQQKDENKE